MAVADQSVFEQSLGVEDLAAVYSLEASCREAEPFQHQLASHHPNITYNKQYTRPAIFHTYIPHTKRVVKHTFLKTNQQILLR